MEESAFSRVQVGVTVKDINQAVKYYEALGIGPFTWLFDDLKLVLTERELYGKDATGVKNLIMVAQMGPVQLEVIQPTTDTQESLATEFLRERGEGINHLGFFVDDIDKELAKLVEKGFKPIQKGKFERGGGFAFFDTGKLGHFLIELIQWPPPSSE